VNLTIGNAGTRIREIGVRKSLGGQKKQLVLQFMTESFLLVLAATTVSLALYPMASPFFSSLVGKNLPDILDFPIAYAAVPIAMIALIGSLSGVYPALVLSSMKTVDALGGKFKTAASNILLRRGLVGFQFCIAMLVLISLSVVSHQVNHFFGKSLGYQKDFVLTSQVPRDWTPAGVRKMRTVRDQFEAMPQVERASISYEIPNGNNGGQPMLYQQSADSTTAIASQAMVTDENYLETYQIPLLSGKFFEAGGQDSGKVVLNEKAVASLGFASPEAAIGQHVRIPRDPTVFTIKGVVKDFQFGSMLSQVQPMVLFSVDGNPIYRFLSFKIQPNATEATIAAITQKWSELLPGSVFEYSFMDETLRKIYSTEFQLKQSATVAAWLSLIISMLGVLGLVSLNIQRRSKEVGVRKVLGASTTGIIGLFLKEFAVLLLVAGIIASPIAWYLTNSWLAQYASRTEPTATHYVVAIAGLSIATLALISLQSMRAALANPVKSLRSE
jgi:putative ABC transport system permease protein